MRPFTFVVMAVALQFGTATAQDRPMRLSADVFVNASFPGDVIEAARKADATALRTTEMRHQLKLHLKIIESAYDRALLQPVIPVGEFATIFERYEAVLLKYQSADRELKTADEVVEARYYVWALEGVNPMSAQVFQKWLEAARADYISMSSDEEEAHRLMLNMGIDRIGRQLRRQKPGFHKAPKIRRIND